MGIQSQKRYMKENIRTINFSMKLMKNVSLKEHISYNKSSGHVGYYSRIVIKYL